MDFFIFDFKVVKSLFIFPIILYIFGFQFNIFFKFQCKNLEVFFNIFKISYKFIEAYTSHF